MRATILFAPLLAVLSAVAAPAPEAGLSVREGEPDILRIGFTEHYCVLPAGTERGLGCPADQQQQVGSTDGSDWTATIEGHEVSIVHLSCTGYTCEDVYIDGVKVGNRILFGPGIHYAYDYELA